MEEKKEFEKRGLHNWRNLFKKPTGKDLLILFMLLMMWGLAYQNHVEVGICREQVKLNQEWWLNLTNGTGELRTTVINYTISTPLNFSVYEK